MVAHYRPEPARLCYSKTWPASAIVTGRQPRGSQDPILPFPFANLEWPSGTRKAANTVRAIDPRYLKRWVTVVIDGKTIRLAAIEAVGTPYEKVLIGTVGGGR